MEDETLICCFTGHRRIPEEHLRLLPDLLDCTLERLIQRNISVFRTGGAIGFDTLAALKVLEKKERYPMIRLQLFLPCRDQNRGWSLLNRSVYDQILTCTDEIFYVQDAYSRGCMQERNRKLVEGSHCCVAYCTSDKGGSAYTLQYAKKQDLRIINLAGLL